MTEELGQRIEMEQLAAARSGINWLHAALAGSGTADACRSLLLLSPYAGWIIQVTEVNYIKSVHVTVERTGDRDKCVTWR